MDLEIKEGFHYSAEALETNLIAPLEVVLNIYTGAFSCMTWRSP
jgi:hypothetical protein